jgi:deoxycytidine triphosphate deaminase
MWATLDRTTTGPAMQIDLEQFNKLVADLFTPDMPTADARYAALAEIDPFPDIQPALMNAGQIASYVAATGMIDPFDTTALAKPATYLVPLEGAVRYRNSEGHVQRFILSNIKDQDDSSSEVRSQLTLERNSLCYVTLKPTFRMPVYIAGRFNLLIRDVYRGLLVGTGPLVDPGFTGRLSIPVHNFTNNEYILRADEGFVYFEFTKLHWKNPSDANAAMWVKPIIDAQPPFPKSKFRRRSLDDYLVDATGGGPATSAVGQEMQRLRKTAKRIKVRFELGTVIALAGLVGLVFTSWQLYLGAQNFADGTATELRAALQSLRSNLDKVSENQSSLGDLGSQLRNLRTDVQRLSDRLDAQLKSGAQSVPHQTTNPAATNNQPPAGNGQ